MSVPGRVVVTGWGTIGSSGAGGVALAEALAASRVDLTEVERPDGYHLAVSARLAARVPADALASFLAPREARRMSPPSRLAAVAARLAIEDAAFDPARRLGAVVLATEFGPTSYSERLSRQILDEGPMAASPALFTESVANAPAAQVALRLDARGPNLTVTERLPGALIAVARAASLVAEGRADWALAGGVEECHPLLHAALDRYHALARPDAEGREIARPFDRRRRGMLLGEGATLLLLERESSARERGARPKARIGAWGSAFDPGCHAAGWPRDGSVLAGSLASRLGRALEGIDLIVSGAAGTRGGDLAEGRLLLALSGLRGDDGLPALVAPAALTGSWCGCTLGPAMVALEGGSFGPTPGFREPDPRLDLEPWRGGEWSAPERVLASAIGVGGSAALLVLEHPEAT